MFTPVIRIGLKSDIIYFFRKVDISMAAVKRKTGNQLEFNSVRIRFDVKQTDTSI